MASFDPISTIFDTATHALDATKTMRNIYGDYRDVARQNQIAQQQYLLNERDFAERAALDERETALQTAEQERKRQQDLRRATAARKAAFGSQGISTADGSGQAVLLGLFQNSDEERKYRERLDALRRDALAQDVENKRRRNLLSLQSTYRSGQDSLFNSINKAL